MVYPVCQVFASALDASQITRGLLCDGVKLLLDLWSGGEDNVKFLFNILIVCLASPNTFCLCPYEIHPNIYILV